MVLLAKARKIRAFVLIIADAEGFNKCRLRYFDFAELAHSLFAFLLFIQQFAIAGDVAAVAFCSHVFTHGRDGFAGNDFAANSRLNRNLEQVPRDEVF